MFNGDTLNFCININAFFQTTLPEFQKTDFMVVRQHEEFVWLHDRFEENEDYAGFIVSTEKVFKLCCKKGIVILQF